MSTTISFGGMLVVIRERLGQLKGQRRPLSQSDLAYLLETQQATVSRWENNLDRPTATSLARLAQLCADAGMDGITYDYLATLVAQPPVDVSHIDPDAVRLSDLLSTHPPQFRQMFMDIVFTLYHLVTWLHHTHIQGDTHGKDIEGPD